jgi:hypothetical protein
MKKYLLVLLLPAFFIVNIMCSKSNDGVPTVKKTNATEVNDVVGGCTCSDNDSSGAYTPTIIASNIVGVSGSKAFFSKIKNVVTVDGHFLWQSATSISQGAFASISFPIAPSTPLVAGSAFGICQITEAGGFVNGIFVPTLYTTRSFINQSPGTTMQIAFSVQTTQAGGTIYYHFVYQLPVIQ